MNATRDPAEAFVRAIIEHDFEGLEAMFAPAVHFRALTPGRIVDVETAAEATEWLRKWFGNTSEVQVVDASADAVVDRRHVSFRLRLLKAGLPRLIEQHAYLDVVDGTLDAVDLLCTGFRQEETSTGEADVHRYDAGDLGCGSGLPGEFRRRISQIPVGHALAVVARDPSAREDLPSLARMMGHRVRSIETGADRTIIITVERGK